MVGSSFLAEMLLAVYTGCDQIIMVYKRKRAISGSARISTISSGRIFRWSSINRKRILIPSDIVPIFLLDGVTSIVKKSVKNRATDQLSHKSIKKISLILQSVGILSLVYIGDLLVLYQIIFKNREMLKVSHYYDFHLSENRFILFLIDSSNITLTKKVSFM